MVKGSGFYLKIKFSFVLLFLSFFLFCCSSRDISSEGLLLKNPDQFDLNNLDWLWNYPYSRESFDDYFGIDKNSYVYVAYLFNKIGYDEKFIEYMNKAINEKDTTQSQFAGVKLLSYHNLRQEYFEAEVLGAKLYEFYPDNKNIVLEYFKSLYWQKKNIEALRVLNKLDKMEFPKSQGDENILFKAALYGNSGNIDESRLYFEKLFKELPVSYLHVRAYDYIMLEDKVKHFDKNFVNFIKVKYGIFNSNSSNVLNLLRTSDLEGYYNNFVFLNDVYEFSKSANKLSLVLTFFKEINSEYKDYFVGVINLKLGNSSGFDLIKKYLESSGIENNSNRLPILSEIFNNLLFTKDSRDYFSENVSKFFKESDKESYSYIKSIEEYILEAVQLEDHENLYKLYRNGQNVIKDSVLSRLAFINARLMYHKFISGNNDEYMKLLEDAISYDRWSYSSFMSKYLLDQNIDYFFTNSSLEVEYEDSEYEKLLEGFLKFKLYPEISKFIVDDFSSGYKFTPNFYRQVYDELVKNEYYYEATIVINYLVRQDESALRKDDYKRIYPYLYTSLVEYWSKRRDLDPSVVFSLIKAESSFKKDAVSIPGALGLMQVMPGTAVDISNEIKYPNYNLKRPKDNIIMGTYYLKKRIEILGSVFKALASYNGGIGNVRKWEKQYGHLPKELFIEAIPFGQTRNYVKKILVYSVFYDSLYENKGIDSAINYIMGEFPKD